jgi:hypothetical protein
MKQIKINRTGLRPLVFEGKQVASEDSYNYGGKMHNRWHEVTVYRGATCWVAKVAYLSKWAGEGAHVDAAAFNTRFDLETWLENYEMPNKDSIGFPKRPEHEARQAALMSKLEAGLRDCIGNVLAKLTDQR